MQLDSLDTKIGANKGAFLHLKHPALRHLMYSGPEADAIGRLTGAQSEETIEVGCFVLGTESETVRAVAKGIQKSKLEGKEDEDGLQFLCSLIVGFQGLNNAKGEPLSSSVEDKATFLKMSDGLGEQVLAFSGERANFFETK